MIASEMECALELARDVLETPDAGADARALAEIVVRGTLNHALVLEAAIEVSANYERYEGARWPSIERLETVLRLVMR